MCNYTISWFIFTIFFLFFELGNPGLFYFLSFACGSAAASLAGLFSASLIDQIVLFFIVSCCALAMLKKWVRRYGNRNHYQSNVYALRGKKGVVIKPALKGEFAGYIHIEGQVWAYKAVKDEMIAAGSSVEVVDVQGAHLVVRPIDEQS